MLMAAPYSELYEVVEPRSVTLSYQIRRIHMDAYAPDRLQKSFYLVHTKVNPPI